jgi:O-antigen/teichoic acid export membrane protein
MSISDSTATQKKASSPVSASWITRSVLSNWFGLAANLVISFFMAPFIVHKLGNSAYGLWALMLQLTGYMGVVDVGLRSALVRFVSRHRAQNDQDGLNELMSSTLQLYSGFALLCLLVGSVLAFFALPHLHVPPGLLLQARNTLLVASVILASDFVFATFQGSLAGLSRWDLRNLISTGVLILRAGLTFAMLSRGHGLVTLALVQLLASLTGHVFEVYFVRRLLPGLRFSWGHLQKKVLRPIFSHSAYSMLIGLGVGINYEVDSIVIAAFLPVQEITFYVIGFNLIKYLRDLINASSMIVAPLASHLDAQGHSHGVSQLLKRGSKYTLLLSYLGCAGLLCLGPDFIRLWMGDEYAARSGKVVIILTLGLFFSLTENIGGHLLFGLGKHRLNVWCTLGEAALNLAASIFLVRHYGIYGVAAGTGLAALVVRGWFFPNAALKVFQVRWREYLAASVLPTVIPTLAFAGGILATRHFIPVHGYGTLCLAAVGGIVAYLPFLYGMGLDAGERAQLRSRLKELFSTRFGVGVVPGVASPDWNGKTDKGL